MGRKIRWLIIVLLLIFVMQNKGVHAEEEDGEGVLPEKNFLIFLEEPDGEANYYRSKPELKLEHYGEKTETKYRIDVSDGTHLEGGLDTGDSVMRFERDIWKEGKNELYVWEEDENGEEIEDTVETRIILLDTMPPGTPEFSYDPVLEDEKAETAYVNGKQKIRIVCEDEGSGIDGIYYKWGEKEHYKKGSRAELTLPEGFCGQITAGAKDKAGHKSRSVVSRKIMVDSVKPQIEISAPNGEGEYSSENVNVRIKVSDISLSSGIKKILCYVNGKKKTEKNYEEETEKETEFSIELERTGEIVVETWDYAGNVSRKKRLVQIDKKLPEVQISGVEHRAITAKEVMIVVSAEDETMLTDMKATVTWTNTLGKESTEQISGKRMKDGQADVKYRCREDGTYRIHVEAVDAAGNRKERQREFVIDKTNPVIRHIEAYQGKYIPYFQWNYKMEETIWDFTSYTYMAKLDNQIYNPGLPYRKEGKHIFEITVSDAAGNKSEAKAEFIIDHTSPVILFYGAKDKETYSYEDEKTVSFMTKEAGDCIEYVYVNGIRRELQEQNGKYFVRFQRPGSHTIQVTAADAAGNRATTVLRFTMEEEKNALEKAVQKVIRKTGPEEGGKGEELAAAKEKEPRKSYRRYGGVLGIFLAGTVCLTIYIVVKRTRKREDAG